MKTRIHWALPALLAMGLALPAAPDKGDKPAEKKAKPGDTYSMVYLGDDKPLLIRLHLGNEGQSVEEAWNKFIDQVFKYLDVNGDGFLDKKEAERTPPPALLLGGNQFGFRGIGGFAAGDGRSMMSQLDTNKDGTTVEERPVGVADLLATAAGALGIDTSKQNNSNVGRPIRIVEPTARPLQEVLA